MNLRKSIFTNLLLPLTLFTGNCFSQTITVVPSPADFYLPSSGFGMDYEFPFQFQVSVKCSSQSYQVWCKFGIYPNDEQIKNDFQLYTSQNQWTGNSQLMGNAKVIDTHPATVSGQTDVFNIRTRLNYSPLTTKTVGGGTMRFSVTDASGSGTNTITYALINVTFYLNQNPKVYQLTVTPTASIFDFKTIPQYQSGITISNKTGISLIFEDNWLFNVYAGQNYFDSTTQPGVKTIPLSRLQIAESGTSWFTLSTTPQTLKSGNATSAAVNFNLDMRVQPVFGDPTQTFTAPLIYVLTAQ